MFSELLHIGPLTLRAYGLCMAIGFLAAWQAAIYLCKRSGQNPEQLTNLLTWMMLASLLGARTAYVLEHWQTEFAGNHAAIIRIDQGGLMFYGGFIAAAIVLFINSLWQKKSLFHTTDLLVAVLPLGHMFGRIGCFFHGCCYGRIVNSWIGVRFPRNSPAWWDQVSANPPLLSSDSFYSLPVIPVQLIEASANLILFVLLFKLVFPRYHTKQGTTTGVYMVSYAILRFGIEYLRGDPRLAIGPLSISQTISLITLLIGIFCLYLANIKIGTTIQSTDKK